MRIVLTLAFVATTVMLGTNRALAQRALLETQPVMTRSGNVLFKMPRNWTRKDTKDGTLLMPPELPEGRWFELRLVPGQESVASPEQAVEEHVAAIRNRYMVLDATAVNNSTHKRGWLSASIALTVNVAQAGGTEPDLRFWVIYAARPMSRIEVLYYISNDYQVYLEQSKTVEQFISDMNYANLIILADGAPKLTELLVNETTDFLEWLLDVPFTEDQRTVMRGAMLDIWKRKAQTEVDATLELVKLRRQFAAIEPEKADFLRAAVQQDFVAEMRKDSTPLCRMLVEIYDAGHKVIAEGKPPLTRQSADAMLESIYFMASVLGGDRMIVPTQEEKDRWASSLAERYAQMPEQQQKGIAQMTTIWAALRWVWPTLTDAEKDQLREQFVQFEPVKQLRQSTVAAQNSQTEDFATTMQRMQQSHESFMMLSNLTSQMHMTNMAMISNIGGGGWRYEYRYR